MPRASVDKATGLTQKQERFCVLYVTGGPEHEGNATACYRAAYSSAKMKPATINRRAQELLHKGVIAARIVALRESVAEKAGITASEVLAIAASMARATLADFYDDAGNLKPPSQWTEQMKIAAAQLKTMEMRDGDGEIGGVVKELKLWDKNAAVERLFKHFGLFEKDNKQKPEATVVVVPAKKDGGY